VNTPLAPLNRQLTGDYSWLISVVPQSSEARNGLVTNPNSYAYDVSVVVFYKRVLPTEKVSAFGINQVAGQIGSYERSVSAQVLSTGLNGGELLLRAMVNQSGVVVDGDPFGNLKTGQYIMLCGPHPSSTDSAPRFALNWYKVLSIQTEGLQKTERIVAVSGPQWPWQPAPSGYSNPHLSNDLCVGIFRGAVAVHSRTIRFEKDDGNSGAMGLTTTDTSIDPNTLGPVGY
jgi:hypothetical protein